jgi:hypothetical protein
MLDCGERGWLSLVRELVIVPNLESCSDVLAEVRSFRQMPQYFFERLHLPMEAVILRYSDVRGF